MAKGDKHKVRVRCTFEIDVEIEDYGQWDNDFIHGMHFMVEDNGCPGTGAVGSAVDAALEKHMAECDKKSFCWACALNGQNQIIAIDGVDVPHA